MKVFNFAFSLALILGLVMGIFAFTKAIKKRSVNEITTKFEPLADGLKNAIAPAKYQVPITMVKWTILSAVLILLQDYSAHQVQIITLLAMLSTAHQLHVQPYASHDENCIALFNELMALLYLLGLTSLMMVAKDPDLADTAGLCILSVLMFTLAVNILRALILAGRYLI